MQLGRYLKTFVAHSLTIALIAFSGSAYGANKEKVLHAFAGGKTGATEFSSLIFDSAGNLYGTAQRGGDMSVCDDAGCGVVFKLTPTAGGKWKETVLYTFSGGKDGAFPSAALTFDSSGNLYGTTANGGSISGQLCQESGCGVVFELSPVGGRWKLIVLHRFHGQDGSQPFAPVTFDTAGNLYGTTASGGGTGGDGVVYKLTPGSNGKWKETVLHAFAGGNDGASPLTGVVLDKSGKLYGSTLGGGNSKDCAGFGCGTVYRLEPQLSGKWKETLLHTFTGGADGATPFDLVLDSSGNLYSTTNSGGSQGNGTAFELSPASGGVWNKTVLHNFGTAGDGGGPGAGLTLDPSGNLYGTTIYGGANCGSGCGIVFRLTTSNGHWDENILYSFHGANDGGGPSSDLVLDSGGNLYGTASGGGVHNAGVAFRISP